MSGRIRWDAIGKEVPPSPCTIQYVKGYIQALETVLRDIDTLLRNEYDDVTVIDVGRVEVLEKITASVTISLESALMILENLTL